MKICIKGDAIEISTGTISLSISAGQIEHYWNSLTHFPDRRARIEISDLATRLIGFESYLDGLAASGGSFDKTAEMENFTKRHVELTRRAWLMDSRCMSSFIVGPARFPLERNRKRMEYADRSYQFVRDHVAAAQRAVEKKAFPHGRPDGAIRSNNPDAPELLLRKISDRRRAHLLMKAANAAIRSAAADDKEAMVQAVVDATGWRESRCREIVCPRETWMGRGFTSDAIAGELAEIKRLEKRLATIMENRARGMIEHSHDTDAGLVRVIENGAAARIQLFFAGKPEQAVRKLLKGNGFRWAPSEGAWQRHLNEAGRYAALRVIASLHKS